MASRQGIGERLAEAAFARVSGGPGRRLLLAFLGTRPGGWALALAHRVLPARQPIGVLAGRPYGLTLVFHATIASDALAETSAEIRHASWLPVAEALTHLRDFEAAAVRLAAGAER
jgi:hypothetical protein